MVVLEEIVNSFEYANELNVYNDGKVSSFVKLSKPFEKIYSAWQQMIDSAREMPAYGVSLNKETLKAIETGVWLEFVFNGKAESNGMPFEKLLVQVEESYQGFNLIRYNSGYGYDGRCFYLDLNGKNMADLYNLLLNI